MDTLNTSFPLHGTTPAAPRRRWLARLTGWLRLASRSGEDRFLAEACDLVDLEHRLRCLERDGLPPGPSLRP